jgi:hypothetical protein
MRKPVQLPPLAQQKDEAAKQYAIASNAMLLALGLDPRQPNTIDLSTGTITPAEPEK